MAIAKTTRGHLCHSDTPAWTAQSELADKARLLQIDLANVGSRARTWTLAARARRHVTWSEALFETFGLDTEEGRALMRLSEALLRTPDRATAWKLLTENLRAAAWRPDATAHCGARIAAALIRWAARIAATHETRLSTCSAPLVWVARAAVARTADQFIVAETLGAARARMRRDPSLQLCSIDCLGESARTGDQALAYFRAYERAIESLAQQPYDDLHLRHGVSVKLSALEPRFGPRHRGTYAAELIPRAQALARAAARANIGLTIDAEEQDRLESTLDVMDGLIEDDETRDWPGLGLAIQAYGLRAPQVIAWLTSKARQFDRRMTVRLVKGAYWDSEIKRGQERGLEAFPVFTHKSETDASYLLAAQTLFRQRDVIFPQFATHNAVTIAAIQALAPPHARFEFQRLHGMGEPMYRVAAAGQPFPPVRVYAPVGSHRDLLAYLIRRILENGANSSCMRQLRDPAAAIDLMFEDPLCAAAERNRPTAGVGAST